MIVKTPFLPFNIKISKSARSPKFKRFGYKVFCIGKNKTGTTSLQKEFHRRGYQVGDQRQAELLTHYYHIHDFDPIIQYCHSGEVFQDVPFSWPGTYRHLDQAFPDARFILSIRDSAEQWVQSLINFAKKRNGGTLPTLEDIKRQDYVYPGWSYYNHLWRYIDRGMNISAIENHMNEKLYDSQILLQRYNQYNEEVISYFQAKPDKLLIINVGQPEDYARFCTFFNLPKDYDGFPWENKT